MSSLNFGYWQDGAACVRGAKRIPDLDAGVHSRSVIKLPGSYRGAAMPAKTYIADAGFGFDDFARSALEANRNSYHPMPTADSREFGAFFSARNYAWLREQIKARSGYYADDGDLFDCMQRAYSMVLPRSDIMDLSRRTVFSDRSVIQSYVDELNCYVLENLGEEVRQANKLWDYYAANRHGPCSDEMPDGPGLDTRTRNVAEFFRGDLHLYPDGNESD